MKTTFIVYGKPVGKARPRFRKTGKFVSVYTPQNTVDYEEKIRQAAVHSTCGKKFPEDVPLKIKFKAYFPIPKSVSRLRKRKCAIGKTQAKGKPDIDNILKTIMDGMQGENGIISDDKCVYAAYGSKWFSFVPRVVVTVIAEEEEEDE